MSERRRHQEKAIRRYGGPVSEDLLVQVAHILGGQSAAAAVLRELSLRRAAGEEVAAWLVHGAYVVGPMPAAKGSVNEMVPRPKEAD